MQNNTEWTLQAQEGHVAKLRDLHLQGSVDSVQGARTGGSGVFTRYTDSRAETIDAQECCATIMMSSHIKRMAAPTSGKSAGVAGEF